MKPFYLAMALALATVGAATADDMTDTLDAVRKAYEEGDIAKAMEELNLAQSILQDMRTESLAQFLPEAPDGWTREVSTEMGGMMAFTGGGIGAIAEYSNGTESFKLSIMGDSPLISAMGAMLSNQMMARAAGANLERMGDLKVLHMDDSLTTLVANRILVQAEGASPEVMQPVMEQIDFTALENFKL